MTATDVTERRPLFTPAPGVFETTEVLELQRVFIVGSPPARTEMDCWEQPKNDPSVVTEIAPENGEFGLGERLMTRWLLKERAAVELPTVLPEVTTKAPLPIVPLEDFDNSDVALIHIEPTAAVVRSLHRCEF